MLSCGLVINHPGSSADPRIAATTKAITFADALIPAYRNACALNLSGRGIHTLKPQAGGQAILTFVFALYRSLFKRKGCRCNGDDL